MQSIIKKDIYPYFDITGVDSAECSVDTEYYLPDYCPDIQKILKCTPDVQIISETLSADKLSITGNLNIIVMYTDEKGDSIRNCELSKEFTLNIKVSTDPSKTLAFLKCCCGHIICRAVSARKLDIHIPVIVNYSFCTLKECEISCDTAGMEKKETTIFVSKAERLIKRDFSISQNIELTSTMKPVESIIRKDIEFTNVKTEVTDDFAELTATAEVTVIYRSYSENSDIEKLKYKIPFSERIEITGIRHKTKLKCDINKGELSLQPKEDTTGENTVISLYSKFTVNLLLYNDEEIKVLEDAYPIDYLSEEKYVKQNFKIYTEEKIPVSFSAELGSENLEKVIDLWCDDSEILAFRELDKINFRGKFNVNLLYLNTDKKVCFLSKPMDFSNQLTINEEKQLKALCSLSVNTGSFKIESEASLKTDFAININAFIEEVITVNMLLSSEEKEIYIPEGGRISVIYSGENRSLWDIAKENRVAAAEILEINGISSEEELSFPILLYKK